MENKSSRASTLLAAALFTLGATQTAFADQKTGTETVTLSNVWAVAMNGSPDPAADGACKDKYGSLLGQKVTSKYDINTKTLMMSASSELSGTTVKLFPMGLSTSYSFMSDGIPPALAEKGVMRVIFSLKTDFTNPESDIMTKLNDTDNCVLSNLAP